MSQIQKVLIAGGGYAGIIAANRLIRKKLPLEIILVTAKEQFQERIRNHQLLAGTLKKAYSIRSLLHDQVELVVSKIDRIDSEKKQVVLEDSSILLYDFLIYSLGIQGAKTSKFSEQYVQLTETEDCRRMYEILKKKETAKITVLGAGLGGIETASELVEQFPNSKISLVDANEIGKGFSSEAVAKIKEFFLKNKVKLIENSRILKYETDHLVDIEGKKIIHDVCVLANGFSASPIGANSGLRSNPIGQVYVNSFLEVEDHPEILGAGDAVQIVSSGYDHLRMACATALPMGIYAAERLSYRLGTKSKKGALPFSLAYLGRNVSLGRKDGVIQESEPDDTPTRKIWISRSAVWIKELICKFTVLSFRLEKRFDFYFWKSFPSSREEFGAGRLAIPSEK
ncbi:FAD-dependent oxidoreductase [Leptospira sp. 201903070]|uniref:FAD-dependent oxidoreductase n=1 Tax=Leptospira ainlahdjerensis TaxID=2810033 RepID=A0ABS2UF73_9LEPT|nr:FAD-dependent oxidoreductase [Leptospira ainlahdjerensis]MBM9579015.1 FAD-dependent oxidoreductase [Leptospira ainlahdjerensis]